MRVLLKKNKSIKFSEQDYIKSIKKIDHVNSSTHNSMDWCTDQLLSQIDAVKYNYSNSRKLMSNCGLLRTSSSFVGIKKMGNFSRQKSILKKFKA